MNEVIEWLQHTIGALAAWLLALAAPYKALIIGVAFFFFLMHMWEHSGEPDESERKRKDDR